MTSSSVSATLPGGGALPAGETGLLPADLLALHLVAASQEGHSKRIFTVPLLRQAARENPVSAIPKCVADPDPCQLGQKVGPPPSAGGCRRAMRPEASGRSGCWPEDRRPRVCRPRGANSRTHSRATTARSRSPRMACTSPRLKYRLAKLGSISAASFVVQSGQPQVLGLEVEVGKVEVRLEVARVVLQGRRQAVESARHLAVVMLEDPQVAVGIGNVVFDLDRLADRHRRRRPRHARGEAVPPRRGLSRTGSWSSCPRGSSKRFIWPRSS